MLMKKVCFAASSGGHFEQLMRLKDLMEKYDAFIVTEKTNYDYKIDKKTYYLSQINRREGLFILKIMAVLIKSVFIFLKERPDIIITTGVLAVIPLCLLAKLFGKKVVYIESFAKVSSPTLTGKFLYKFADML